MSDNLWVRARTESIHFDSPNWIKNKKNFDSRGESKYFFELWLTFANHFILDSDSFWFTFEANKSHWFNFICICFHFYLRFNTILFILIRFDFDSSQITIQPRIMICLKIKNQVESKINGKKLMACFWTDSPRLTYPLDLN